MQNQGRLRIDHYLSARRFAQTVLVDHTIAAHNRVFSLRYVYNLGLAVRIKNYDNRIPHISDGMPIQRKAEQTRL